MTKISQVILDLSRPLFANLSKIHPFLVTQAEVELRLDPLFAIKLRMNTRIFLNSDMQSNYLPIFGPNQPCLYLNEVKCKNWFKLSGIP